MRRPDHASPIAPDSRRIVYQITDGKIAGHTMAIDQLDLMKQLGVMQ